MWNPNPEILSRLTRVLSHASHGDTASQKALQTELANLRASTVDLNMYYVYIFGSSSVNADIRAIAGLSLKNQLRYMDLSTMAREQIEFMKQASLQALACEMALVSNTSGTLITTLIAQGTLDLWPDLLAQLMGMFMNPEVHYKLGYLNALTKICEDNVKELEHHASKPLENVVPFLLNLLQHPQIIMKVKALDCLNHLISLSSEALNKNLEKFVGLLASLSNQEKSEEIKVPLCRCLVSLLETYGVSLQQLYPSVIEYMIDIASNSKDSHVAQEATEFFLAMAEMQELCKMLVPYFDRLIPLLMKNMIYLPEYEIVIQHGDELTGSIERKDNLKPRHHKQKNRSNEDDEDEEDDDDLEDDFGDWNLRKCSAATIDILATQKQLMNDFLKILLPTINNYILNQQWEIKEVGILALGAIAEGCEQVISQNLPQLFPFLMENINHPRPLVRSITCWCLSRYATWFTETIHHDDSKYFAPLLEALLHRLMDKSSYVQQSACTALSMFQDSAGPFMEKYLLAIINSYINAFKSYDSKRNQLVVLDSIRSLIENCSEQLNAPQYLEILCPFFINLLNQLHVSDVLVYGVMEAVTSLVLAGGVHAIEFSNQVFIHSLNMWKLSVHEQELFVTDPSRDEPELDIETSAIDAIAACFEGLGNAIDPILSSKKQEFYELLLKAINDPDKSVVESAVMLIGDMASHSFNNILPILPMVIPILIKLIPDVLDPMWSVLTSNLFWALSVITIGWGSNIEQYADHIMQKALKVFSQQNNRRQVLENIAILIGRMATVCPLKVAALFSTGFLPSWCIALNYVVSPGEKVSAFDGLCDAIMADPNKVTKHIPFVCYSFLSYHGAPEIVVGYRDMIGHTWDNLLAQSNILNQEDINKLNTRFLK
ncbi:ARM repeat-containing protein [Rozella allomycis CSF55]|uniref:ARM repeat-containing protein n=1 Tax=Rozella allomycis (strain CSF55) TaxID=988480 RepID=A0A4P9YJ68_ROZAC|nr:ARM repeat-containing protein [Rozella allomycis CSF55]